MIGLTATLSGGTRRGINLNRPWQHDLVVDPETCPFETVAQQEITRLDIGDETWRILQNLHTPFDFHRLIIPERCWPSEELRLLGGTTKIEAALQILALTIIDEREYWIGVHVGSLAGQNVSHLHYHVVHPHSPRVPSPSVQKQILDAHALNPALTILTSTEFLAFVGGSRAGQCFLMPRADISLAAATRSMADFLDQLLRLYAFRFRSKQGLPPDYILGMNIQSGRIAYAYYSPILTNWGFTEQFALLEGTPIVLPWPHEDTAAHLCS